MQRARGAREAEVHVWGGKGARPGFGGRGGKVGRARYWGVQCNGARLLDKMGETRARGNTMCKDGGC